MARIVVKAMNIMSHTVKVDSVIERLDYLMARDTFESSESFRIFHGRGNTYDGLSGLCMDFFQPVILCTFFDASLCDIEKELMTLLNSRLLTMNASCVLIQRRYLNKAPIEVAIGNLPDRVYARRKGLRYLLSFMQQNVGFFLDIEPARVWLEQQCENKHVLNLFSYTCAFSVVAAAAGAKAVVNMDMSSRALSIGRQNHEVNGVSTDDIRFFAYDIFKSWGRINRHGPYDIVIVDPPSFQKGSFVASKDYQRVMRKLGQLVAPNGCFLACLNAPEITLNEFRTMFEREAPEFESLEYIDACEFFPDTSNDKRLKMLLGRR